MTGHHQYERSHPGSEHHDREYSAFRANWPGLRDRTQAVVAAYE